MILGDTLAAQLNVTVCCIGAGTAVAMKFIPVTEAPFMLAEAVDGLNV
jgi:hypothetical protein